MTKKIFSIILIVLLIGSIDLFKFSKSRDYQFLGGIYDSVRTNEKILALTIDDGPSPGFTREVLDILNNETIKTTFFFNWTRYCSESQRSSRNYKSRT